MISKVLVANRGEIAIRAFRAAYEMGIATVAVYAVRGPQLPAPAEGRRVLSDRRDRATRCARTCRSTRSSASPSMPAPTRSTRVTASSRRTRNWPPRAREAGITFVGPGAARAGADRQQVPRDRRGARRGPAGAGVLGAVGVGRRAGRRVGGHGVPAVRQGGVRRWRPRHAAGRPIPTALAEAIEAASREAESAFGDPMVYLEQAVINPRHIEVQILADTHGQRDPPLRAGLQRAAPPPEGHRAGARAEPARGAAGQDLRRRGRVRAADRLHLRGHRGVPARRARPSRVHRDESAHPGRAHRHRGDHRRRPGGQPAAHRRGGDAGRSRAEPGRRCRSAARPCSAGSPPRTRPTASGPTPAASPATGRRAARASGSTAAPTSGAEIGAHFDSMLVKLTCRGRDFSTAVARARRGVGGVPDPRGVDEHPVPAGGRRRSRLPGGPGHHVVHRRAARSC